MSLITALLREDLRGFAGYRSARCEQFNGGQANCPQARETIWLNANESPRPNAVDEAGALRRYPEPQPQQLRAALADLYGALPQQVLIGRGSDEAIDLLVRAFCVPGRDRVVVTPPVFGMYAVCARLHGTRVLEVPLRDGVLDYQIDFDAIATVASQQQAKLVFLCSPGNPAGAALPAAAVLALAHSLAGRALVVVDEAYIEFADAPSLAGRIDRQQNLAVLRTLSKAHALAGARIGCLIADAEVIEALRRCQAPYPVPVPCLQQAMRGLSDQARLHTEAGVHEVRREREQLRAALAAAPGVRRVYPSQANFLLVRFNDAQNALERLLAAAIVVRDMRALPGLGDALRISVGSAVQNQRVLAALRGLAEAA
ncbi:MAG: histidinol-phosphate transaminase [Gammaproteobacteria bacterium]|nr:histidinol-phosphate transaminase [Gammaproteobacteria bacterium]